MSNIGHLDEEDAGSFVSLDALLPKEAKHDLVSVGHGIDSLAAALGDADFPSYAAEAPSELAPPRKEGWLHKEGHGPSVLGADWKKRYFVLANGFLEYFEEPSHSPLPWGTHLTSARAGTHAINVRGHLWLAGSTLASTKRVRYDARGQPRAAWRVDLTLGPPTTTTAAVVAGHRERRDSAAQAAAQAQEQRRGWRGVVGGWRRRRRGLRAPTR